MHQFKNLAPLRNKDAKDKPWEGNCKKKPWEYNITAAIPVLDTYDSLELCIKLLQLQTEKPYIIIIDTGSNEENLNKILDLHSENIEIHCIRQNGVLHPSDPVSMSMDLAQSLCRTKYLFATHSDVFLKRRDFLSDILNICGDEEGFYPIVGYEISPRQHDDWHGMVSHTATIYHVPTLDKIGFGWSMRRLAHICDLENQAPHPDRPNWPDTEILGNIILRENKINIKLIGHEENFKRNVDDNIDHVRSLTIGMLYSPTYEKASKTWFEEAKKQAKNRILEWQREVDERVS